MPRKSKGAGKQHRGAVSIKRPRHSESELQVIMEEPLPVDFSASMVPHAEIPAGATDMQSDAHLPKASGASASLESIFKDAAELLQRAWRRNFRYYTTPKVIRALMKVINIEHVKSKR